MSLRDTINKNPAVAAAVVGALVVLAIGYALYSIGVFGGSAAIAGGGDVYIRETDDSYRPGTPEELYELSSNGEPNAIAHVYRYPGGEPFVHYFERLHPRAIEALSRLPEDPDNFEVAMQRDDIINASQEVRRPGQENWIPMASQAGLQIADIPPDNEQGQMAEKVFP